MTQPKAKPTMTDLLKQAITDAGSFRAIETATGVKRQSLMKFVRDEQSLRLDMADKLAAYFGIESRRTRRKGK
jgi:plasmid maintenance system antidote protein VapI